MRRSTSFPWLKVILASLDAADIILLHARLQALASAFRPGRRGDRAKQMRTAMTVLLRCCGGGVKLPGPISSLGRSTVPCSIQILPSLDVSMNIIGWPVSDIRAADTACVADKLTSRGSMSYGSTPSSITARGEGEEKGWTFMQTITSRRPPTS